MTSTLLLQAARYSVVLAVVLVVASWAPLIAQSTEVRIIQTNAAGDNTHVIDPATNKVVGVITGIGEVPHGVAVSPDGNVIYISSEADKTLDVVDAKTLTLKKKIALTGVPNNIAGSKDGRRVYVGIWEAPGAVDVVDTMSLTVVKTIWTAGQIHNLYVTPDGNHVVAGSNRQNNITVINTKTETPEWVLFFDGAVRPFTFETNPDGSTKRILVQIGAFPGFYVVDFEKRKEVGRVTLPDVPPEKRSDVARGIPTHGIFAAPDGKSVWLPNRWDRRVYAFSLPDLKLIGGAPVGAVPLWLTITPDSKFVYVANSADNDVSVIDAQTMKAVARIPVGNYPERNIAASLTRFQAAPTSSAAAAPASIARVLDFEVFRASVQPIFLKKREGRARCVSCHGSAKASGVFGLQPLAAGDASWNDEASRRNFEAVRKLVVPGEPLASRLALKPLARTAGGDPNHNGGKHWESQDDPEWKALAAWIRGVTPGTR